VKKKRDGSFKVEPGSIVMTCFTSDFLLKDADEWREECWEMIKSRSDCMFYFFTKRIERFMECVPADWGEGYSNVIVGCTCENQDRADFRLPIFTELPIKHKTVIIGPMLGPIELEKYLNGSICEVACSGESGINVRPLDYDWVLDVRRQCMNKGVPFQFHQTGAYFIKNGRMYRVPRRFQTLQARKAGIDYKIVDGYMPDI
jgi:protein gp37